MSDTPAPPPSVSTSIAGAAARADSRRESAPVRLVRLPVDKPQPAVDVLRAHSRGVMDLIAHFWERLAQTPPLQRPDLHLVLAMPSEYIHINIQQSEWLKACGAMLYVPKAHRADVLALDLQAASAFAAYIAHCGTSETPGSVEGNSGPSNAPEIPFSDLTTGRGDTVAVSSEPARASKAPAIDFLTGQADGLTAMAGLLLPMVGRKTPARRLINVVMQLPLEAQTSANSKVRLARDADIPLLNRWRRLYKEERGILFDADMDASIESQRIFVYELEATGSEPSHVVAVAKVDLELQDVMEIGGVFTFPEFRNRGFGAAIVGDLAHRIRQNGKTPILQVDEANDSALRLYRAAGWHELGRLARIWLTG